MSDGDGDGGGITLAEAGAILARRWGRRPISITTLYRWTKGGIRGVVLAAKPHGWALRTTRAAVEEFAAGVEGSRSRAGDEAPTGDAPSPGPGSGPPGGRGRT